MKYQSNPQLWLAIMIPKIYQRLSQCLSDRPGLVNTSMLLINNPISLSANRPNPPLTIMPVIKITRLVTNTKSIFPLDLHNY